MIEDIQIRNLGVIRDAELNFSSGLNVLTGETGAGKTMVLTALGLLLGERSDSASIRAGESQTSVSGIWQLPAENEALSRAEDAGALIEDGTLILSRSVTSDGRSKAAAGGRQIPVGILNEIGQMLVVVHGQSDQLRLKSQAAQREALDNFAGANHLELLRNYSSCYQRFKDAETKLKDARTGTEKLALERQDLSDAVSFLEQLNPKPDEDVELQELASRLTNIEQLRSAIALAHELLSTQDFESKDAISLVGQARKSLEGAAAYDSALEALVEKLRSLGSDLNEVSAELSSYLTSIESDNRLNLDEIQERRSQISIAMRRFGPTLQDVLNFWETASKRLVELDGGTQSIELLELLVSQISTELEDLASKLTDSRLKAADLLAERVTMELESLAMANAELVVSVDSDSELGPFGRDRISFLLRSYVGAEPRPISKAASGGELSRIMLALEVVLAEGESVATFVFDEVDAGVGGAAAIEVGRRLSRLAKSAQVIVVTHLAQVAAFADNHLKVVKNELGAFTASDVKKLVEQDRQAELARMLSGLQDSQAAIDHAQELLELAKTV